MSEWKIIIFKMNFFLATRFFFKLKKKTNQLKEHTNFTNPIMWHTKQRQQPQTHFKLIKSHT